MYDSSVPFTQEEVNEIEKNELTVAELKDFYTRFPDQTLEAAIGGCLDEKKAKSLGQEPMLDSSLQESPNEFVEPAPEASSEETSSGEETAPTPAE